MSVSIRRATYADVQSMQECNVHCLPENYQLKYWMYHLLTWPGLQYVADAGDGKIVGYVLAKIEEDDPIPHGHITSLAVMRTYRKTGLATKIMNLSQRSMVEIYGATYVSLHVRETNFAAYHLYHDTLKFDKHATEQKYYADGENAFDMRRTISREIFGLKPKAGALALTDSASATGPAAAGAGGVKGKVAEKRGRAAGASAAAGGGAADAGSATTPSVTGGAEDSKEAEEEAVSAALEKAGEAGDIEPGAAVVAEAVAATAGGSGSGSGGGSKGKKGKGKK